MRSIKAYPRAGAVRTGDDDACFGTKPMFRLAVFRGIRKPLKERPGDWVPRVAMRVEAVD